MFQTNAAKTMAARMLSRRHLLLASIAGTVAGGFAHPAWAFSIETTPKVATDAFALACKPLAGGGHGVLLTSAQATLKAEIARGVLAANAQEVVVCPICGCRFIVTADSTD
jgi:hypothetical protein